ncbi:MAG: MBL fold metallo-hydrolase [Fusobacteriota bacterium]
MGFKIKLWGTRGSYPVSGERSLKYGGNTTCVEIETEMGIVIIDAGTGIIDLGKKIVKEKKWNTINMIFTHTHKDHTEGMSSFLPAHLGNYKLNIFGPKFLGVGIKDVIANTMNHSYFPVSYEEMDSQKEALDLCSVNILVLKKGNQGLVKYNKFHSDYNITKDDLVIKVLKGYNHPKNGIYIYKIEYKNKSFVFATDVESYSGGDTKLIKFSSEADLLIHDAAYLKKDYLNKQGWGHSTPEMAAENAKRANVKKLLLTHHDPESTDEEIEKKVNIARKIFKNSDIAYEGLEIDMLKMKNIQD